MDILRAQSWYHEGTQCAYVHVLGCEHTHTPSTPLYVIALTYIQKGTDRKDEDSYKPRKKSHPR